MTLDTGETDRSYRFGRALAHAQQLESSALRKARMDRDTNAGSMQAACSRRPAKTWEALRLPFRMPEYFTIAAEPRNGLERDVYDGV